MIFKHESLFINSRISPITNTEDVRHDKSFAKNHISLSNKSNLFYGNQILGAVAVNIAK